MTRRRHCNWFAVSLSAALAIACFPSGPDFLEASRVRGVRVIAVTPEPGSGAPGREVTLNMEVFDALQHPWVREAVREATGSPAADEPLVPVQIVWLGGCHNPPGDAQYGCYPLLNQIAENLPDPLPTDLDDMRPEAQLIGTGPSFKTSIPDDILEHRQQGTQTPAFGVSFVFFGACRGTLRPAPEIREGVPLRCVDTLDRDVPAEGFVRGFTRIYTYADSVNANPETTATLNGLPLTEQSCETDADCEDYGAGEFGAACAAAFAPTLASSTAVAPARCLPSVKVCEGPDCDPLVLRAEVSRDSVELDPASARDGDAPEEILWVKYYAFGGLGDDESLINDRASGFHDDYSTEWRPPNAASAVPLPIWAVTQDSRGGSSVTRWDVVVTE